MSPFDGNQVPVQNGQNLYFLETWLFLFYQKRSLVFPVLTCTTPGAKEDRSVLPKRNGTVTPRSVLMSAPSG